MTNKGVKCWPVLKRTDPGPASWPAAPPPQLTFAAQLARPESTVGVPGKPGLFWERPSSPQLHPRGAAGDEIQAGVMEMSLPPAATSRPPPARPHAAGPLFPMLPVFNGGQPWNFSISEHSRSSGLFYLLSLPLPGVSNSWCDAR